MNMDHELHLRQMQEWVKYRLRALDEIEARLLEMRSIAVSAGDSRLDMLARQEMNHRLHALEREVNELDKKSRTFWPYCQ